MKRGAVLINVARGDIVCRGGALRALKDKVIAGAMLDTWYVYPSAASPTTHPSAPSLPRADERLMTPHASGWTDKLLDRRGGR